MATDIFQNGTKSLPKSDPQIVRIGMKQNEIAGRTDHVPTPTMGGGMAIQHVPNAGGKQ
jgi:hypothetical protein